MIIASSNNGSIDAEIQKNFYLAGVREVIVINEKDVEERNVADVMIYAGLPNNRGYPRIPSIIVNVAGTQGIVSIARPDNDDMIIRRVGSLTEQLATSSSGPFAYQPLISIVCAVGVQEAIKIITGTGNQLCNTFLIDGKSLKSKVIELN